MTDYSKMDEQFRSGQDDWKGQPGDAAWSDLSDRLADHQAGRLKRRRSIYRISAVASVAMLMTISIYMFNNSFEPSGFHAQHTDMDVPEYENGALQVKPAMSEGQNKNVTRSMANENDIHEEAPTDFNNDITRLDGSGIADKLPTKQVEPTASLAKTTREESVIEESIKDDMAEEEISNYSGLAEVAEDHDISSVSAESPDGLSDNVNATAAFTDTYNADAMTDEVKLTEPEILTETAVANAAGVEAKKAEQQSRSDRENRSKQDRSTAVKTDKSGAEAYYQQKGDRTEEYVTTSIVVLIPTEKRSTCKYVAFQLENNLYFIDRCQNDRYDILRTESMPIERSRVLSDLQLYDREYLRSLENQTKSGPCLPSAKSVVIVYRTGTTLSYYEEAIRLPVQEFCLPDEAKGIVRELMGLRDSVLSGE